MIQFQGWAGKSLNGIISLTSIDCLRQRNDAIILFSLMVNFINILPGHFLYWCQFHQHYTCAFFVQTSFWQLLSSYITCTLNVRRKSRWNDVCTKKRARISLMQLTPRENLREALWYEKRARKCWRHRPPGVNFSNIFARFFLENRINENHFLADSIWQTAKRFWQMENKFGEFWHSFWLV